MAQKIKRNQSCPCGSGLKYKKCHGAANRSASPPNAVIATTADPPRRWKPYSELSQFEALRRREIDEIFTDEFAFIDDCLALAAKLVEALGDCRPSSVEDVAMRDLSCDAFEFLYQAKKAVAENRTTVVFPLLRRAFENTSLCHLFMVKPEFARKWSEGVKISNADVRKHLEQAPMTEPVEQFRERYQHFSQGAHPNRTHVSFRFLGEGNAFTLGAIPPIDLLALGGHVEQLMHLCYWYIGVFCYFYRESLRRQIGANFRAEFLKLTPRSKELGDALEKQLAELREKLMQQGKPKGIGPAYLE